MSNRHNSPAQLEPVNFGRTGARPAANGGNYSGEGGGGSHHHRHHQGTPPGGRNGSNGGVSGSGGGERGGEGGVFPWVSPHSKKGGGGDPFQDTSGRPVTNVRQRQGGDALKEGMRESPGALNCMDKDAYKRMLTDQIEVSKRDKAEQERQLNATLWWEKKERRERKDAASDDQQSSAQDLQPPRLPPQYQQQSEQRSQNHNDHQEQRHEGGGGGYVGDHYRGNVDSNGGDGHYDHEDNPRMAMMPPISQRSQQWAERVDDGNGCGALSPPQNSRGGGGEGGGRGGSSRSAMEVLVLENSDLRRENSELKARLVQYEARFGRI